MQALSSKMAALSTDRRAKIKGTCKWFDAKKGYGFVEAKGIVGQIFIHQSDILQEDGFRCLVEGEDVEFELHITPSDLKHETRKQGKHVERKKAFVDQLVAEKLNNELAPADWPANVRPLAGKHIGWVKKYNVDRGFGFLGSGIWKNGELVPDSVKFDCDIFVHYTQIVADGFKTLKVGELVEFNAEEDTDDGWKAYDVSGPGGEEVIGIPKPKGRQAGNSRQRSY